MRIGCPQVIIENYFEPCILFAIMKKPSYGYDIQKELKEKCVCKVNTGNLYRCLNRFEKVGYVTRKITESTKGPTRKLYEITKEGKMYLHTWMESLENQQAIVNLLLIQYKKSL